MLLTITYEGRGTQDLGYLLHKNPERAQQFELSYGKAYVFYPEVSDERTTAALLLDIDPLDLARGKAGSREGGLFDYVNDRPYASTSFMSTAIARIFGTAMSGRCDKRQELADTPLKLTARLYSLKDNGDRSLAKEMFEPLGYMVETTRTMLDSNFPEWGESPYIDLTISGTVKLSELLNHIYVLIPVFDKQKHYYTSEDEIRKLLEHGEGWLADHPCKEKITRRYFAAKGSYARKTLDILLADENAGDEVPEGEENADAAEEKETRLSLNTQRMEAVKNAVLASGAASVIDLGCGECRLTSLLLNEPQITKVTACDISVSVLEKAAQRLHLDRMQTFRKNKLTLMQASLTYRDKRFEGYGCACVVEVIEHIEPMRIPAFERAVFEFAAPKTVILTTPNREYNANYENLPKNTLRHGDHRFEWTREEFRQWTEHICEKFGYTCEISGIGDVDENLGTPTQMGVFRKNG
ncbi:MAG: 3' terminal RNA ribose 2'-O-methyltransferase Hen1 [Ruminococcaceae bacterium]|nr:3' terminal RNA ribose 2'-O-methyltransferase Hen1 [Oscillospiraceae bacterium]